MTADLEGRILSAAEGRGRLFLDRTPEADIRGLYAAPYDDVEGLARTWRHLVDRRVAMAREVGAELVFLLAPDAHGVHREDLPADWSFSAPTVGDRFAEAFGDRASVLALCAPLRDCDGAAPVWRRTDSHWSAWGAYAAYRMLMDALAARLRPRIVQPEELDFAWRDELGDLGALGAARGAQAPVVQVRHARACPGEERVNARRDAYKVFEVDDPSLPTCLVFRNSFATELAPYLVESFRRTVLVSSGARGLPELIAEERPDVVLVVQAERSLPLGVVDWGLTTWREHFPAPGVGPMEPEALRAERRAWRALDAGEGAEALAAASQAVALGETPDRRFMLGRARFLMGELDGARADFEAAHAHAPDRFAFLFHVGLVRLRQGFTAAARDLFARACALAPWHPLGWEHLGYAELALGDLAPARLALERSVRLAPEHPGGWSWLARVHGAQDRPDLARLALERGLAASPGDPALTVQRIELDRTPVDIAPIAA